jgi:hypothetical protein
MRYSLRTLLILMAVLPPVLAWLLAGNPLVVSLVIFAVLELGLLYLIDGFRQVAARPHTSWGFPSWHHFAIRDVIAIAGIAVASSLAGVGLWAADTPEESAPVVALFAFGTACYGLGAFITHPRRTEP